MDTVLGLLINHFKLLAAVLVCVILLKTVMVLTSKKGGLYVVVESFFKFYDSVEMSLSKNNNETIFKITNNYLNVVIYALLVIIVMLAIITKDLPN